MKKTYCNPNITVLAIATRQMLADSASARSVVDSEAVKSGTGDYEDARGNGYDW